MRIALSLAKLLFVCFLVLLVITQVTDADLLDRSVIPTNQYKATTLDFSNRDTANNAPRSFLFQNAGFLPGGFAVEALRVQKEGELDFGYSVQFTFLSGQQELCQQLNLRIMQDWQTVYEGKLSELAFSSEVQDDGQDDLVFVIELPGSASPASNSSCVFDFLFTTQNNEERIRFTDEERIQNIITTGS